MPKLMKTLNNISRCQSNYRSKKLEPERLWVGHHAFVLAICRNEGSSQEKIARELCLDKSTVARALNRLEEKGLIERRTNAENKRELLVFPTQKMLDLLPEVRAIAKEWNALIVSEIPEDELSVFYSVLSRIENKAKDIIKGLEGDKK